MPFHRSPIELFVTSFIKQNRRDITGRAYINKAIALIDKKLGYCCDNPEGTLDLVTRLDNNLTNAVRMFLSTMSLEGNRLSLERTKAKLQGFITLCCP